jgi:hypothetical protein
MYHVSVSPRPKQALAVTLWPFSLRFVCLPTTDTRIAGHVKKKVSLFLAYRCFQSCPSCIVWFGWWLYLATEGVSKQQEFWLCDDTYHVSSLLYGILPMVMVLGSCCCWWIVGWSLCFITFLILSFAHDHGVGFMLLLVEDSSWWFGCWLVVAIRIECRPCEIVIEGLHFATGTKTCRTCRKPCDSWPQKNCSHWQLTILLAISFWKTSLTSKSHICG